MYNFILTKTQRDAFIKAWKAEAVATHKDSASQSAEDHLEFHLLHSTVEDFQHKAKKAFSPSKDGSYENVRQIISNLRYRYKLKRSNYVSDMTDEQYAQGYSMLDALHRAI